MTRRGFTFVELLMAVVITSIIGMAVTTLLTAASRGMTVTRASQSALQRAHALQARVRSYTDQALCLLQYRADDALAIWLEDASPADRRVNLSEVRVFWFDAKAGTISVERAEFPASMTSEELDLYDLVLTPGADFITEMTTLRGLGYTRTETLADGVASFGLAWHEVDIQDDRRAVLETSLTLGQDEHQSMIACLGLPSHTEPE